MTWGLEPSPRYHRHPNCTSTQVALSPPTSWISKWKEIGLILPTGQWYAPSAVINYAWYCKVLHGLAWYCMALHGIAWYCIVLHSIAWYCLVLHGFACYCMVLHGIALYCRVLHGIAWCCMVLHGIAWFQFFSFSKIYFQDRKTE